jgi:post-segregation antitoxin (ccd killing protein)
MPKRWGRRVTAQRRGLCQAFRRAAKRGVLDEKFARSTLAADLGFSAEELARLLAESDAARRRAENKDALDSSNAYVEEHGLPSAPPPIRY